LSTIATNYQQSSCKVEHGDGPVVFDFDKNGMEKDSKNGILVASEIREGGHNTGVESPRVPTAFSAASSNHDDIERWRAGRPSRREKRCLGLGSSNRPESRSSNESMGNPAAERQIFEAFLRAAPDFAGEALQDWKHPATDPPDILCTTISGRIIGVELGEWLSEDQMREAKGLESIQTSILEAIGEQPDNASQNIYYVWLHPRARARVKPADALAFRQEIFKVVSDVDLRWDQEEEWQSSQGCFVQDFAAYPTLAKYLQSLTFFPRRQCRPDGAIERTWPPGVPWLTFRAPGGAYSEVAMVEALCALLAKKSEKYEAKPPQAQMDDFYLLIHYNQALLYNTPVETLRFKFADAARAGTAFIADDPGIFNKIFLLLAIEPGERVFQLYPG
jgi:hypothetical protein